MPWNYLSTARTAFRSLHSPHSSELTQQFRLKRPQIHVLKSRRIHTHIWQSTSTNQLLNTVQSTSRPFPSTLSRKEILQDQISATRSASTFASEQSFDHVADVEEPTPSFDVSTLTPAQTSRAARQAVILALQNQVGGWQDALHIINSLYQPILRQKPEAADSPNITSYPAMTFNQPVSPRLASHALMHTLVRQKQSTHAASLAMAMMQCGTIIHTRTLDTIMQSLKPQDRQHNIFKATLPPNFDPNPQGFNELAEMAEQPSTRLALQIFAVARRTGQENMRGLFSTLLAICLINTEIVIASLAFAMIVKEFYHPPPSPEGDTTESTWNADKYGPRSLVFLPQWSHLIDLTTPMQNYFRRITALHTSAPLFNRDTLDANLQALAILANLLDSRQFHLPPMSTLLTLMYNTPRTDSSVWVVDEEGQVHEVAAFQYFHDVLVRLIESPPHPGGPGTPKLSCRAFTPPLGIKPCNTLLHYALRHCHSRDLGNKVLVHLTQARKLVPDDTTLNILLRSGTLLRDDDLASLALLAMTNSSKDRSKRGPPYKYKSNSGGIIPIEVLFRSQSEMARLIASVIETINSIHLWPFSRNRLAKLKHALYTLNTLLMHLCSTGRPHYVKTIVFALFPPLLRSPSTPLEEHMVERRKAIRQGSRFGPLPFAIMLNALVKARAFSEARLLYNFAVAAERRSWFTPRPWALGIETYTVMLELCAAECRHAKKLEGIPAAVADEKPADVRAKAVRMALRLYKRLNKVPYTAHNMMQRFGHAQHFDKLKFPQSDERFASSLIKVLVLLTNQIDPALVATSDIIVKHRYPRPRIVAKMSSASAAEMYTQTADNLRENTELPKGWTAQLQFIARGIVNAGMDVPPALRHLFLGRFDEAADPLQKERGMSLRVVPWAYEAEKKEGSWHPWVVSSIRTRGMVLRKMTRKQRKRWTNYQKRHSGVR